MDHPLQRPTKRDELEHPTVPAVEARRALSLRAVEQLQRSAHTLYEHQLFREAATLFKCLTSIAPTNPGNWYWLGRSYYAVGDPMSAAYAFELGGRLSHGVYFRALASEAWQRAGYPQRAWERAESAERAWERAESAERAWERAESTERAWASP